MPRTIKIQQIAIKDPDTGTYSGVDVLSEQIEQGLIAELQAEGTTQVNRINQAAVDVQAAVDQAESDAATIISSTQTSINTLETQKNTIAATVASMAELGTDTTLSTPGMAADGKKTGDEISNLSRQTNDLITTLSEESIPTFTWRQGAITTSEGRNTSGDNRIRTAEYLISSVALKIVVPEGKRMKWFQYSNQTVSGYIGTNDGWLTGTVTILNNGNYYRFVLANVDDSLISPSDVDGIDIIYSYELTDKTFTLENKCADSKATGDALARLREELNETTIASKTSFAIMDSSIFVWEMGKGINYTGKDVSHGGVARTPHFPVSAGIEIEGLCVSQNPNNVALTLYICEYNNGVFVNRIALAYGEEYIVPDNVTSLRFTYGYSSDSGLTLTKNEIAAYFKLRLSLWDNAWNVVDRPYLVAFGASTTDATIHHYDSDGGNTKSPIAFPEYVASCLNLKCCNLGVGSTGFLSRAGGSLKNFLDQIYTNGDVLSKAAVVVLMFGYGNDSAAGLPIGIYTDYYPYDAEGYHPSGAEGVETMKNKGITLMGALNWCIKWINEHYPMAQIIPVFGAPSANQDRSITMTVQTEAPGVAPYTLNFSDPYDESGTATNKKIKQISEELAKLKAAINIPIVDMFFDGGAFSWWSTYAEKTITVEGQDYTEYALFSTTGALDNPVWNSHPNKDGYLAYSRIIAGRIAGLVQYRY